MVEKGGERVDAHGVGVANRGRLDDVSRVPRENLLRRELGERLVALAQVPPELGHVRGNRAGRNVVAAGREREDHGQVLRVTRRRADEASHERSLGARGERRHRQGRRDADELAGAHGARGDDAAAERAVPDDLDRADVIGAPAERRRRSAKEERGHVVITRERLGLEELALGEGVEGGGILGFLVQELLEGLDGVGVPPEAVERHRALVQSLVVRRIGRERGVGVDEREVELADAEVALGAVGEGHRVVGLDLERLGVASGGGAVVAPAEQLVALLPQGLRGPVGNGRCAIGGRGVLRSLLLLGGEKVDHALGGLGCHRVCTKAALGGCVRRGRPLCLCSSAVLMLTFYRKTPETPCDWLELRYEPISRSSVCCP